MEQVLVFPMLAALSAAVRPSSQVNHTADWWAGVPEEDAIRSLPLDGEGGLWASSFVPPPPRPDFLDDHATPDGLTTCDLCTWAWHDRGGLFSTDASQENPGELGWVVTLAIVSIISAAIGAIVMVTVIQCRNRLKIVGSMGMCSLCISRSPAPPNPPRPPPDRRRVRQGDKDLTVGHVDNPVGGGRVWSWLSSRRAMPGPPQLSSPAPTAPAENHYTMDEAYTTVGEALYAELDRDSSPAYQNTAYNGSDTDPDGPMSSAPSSAYYSDLSCATAPDRTYEAVGVIVATGPGWDGGGDIALRRQPRLAAITETITVPSDYV